jgi:thiosulfate/3-mercaptopyruvate sulfurtransferase
MKKVGQVVGLVVVIALVIAGLKFFGTEKVVVDTSEQMHKIKEYANPNNFVTPFQLNEMLKSKKTHVVVIGSLNPAKMAAPIAGSFTMWRSDYSAAKDAYPFGGMRNTTEEMEKILSSFGATPESTIVVYAAGKHHNAARVWWQIKQLVHKDVRFLDGGLNAWEGAGYATGNANPTVKATNYKASNPVAWALADMDMVKNAIASDEWIIIDTRSTKENDGSSVKKDAFGPGSIPTSVFINWENCNNEDSTMKSLAELKALYSDLVKGKKLITFCQSGVRSAHTAMVLKEILGAQDVYNYDGSWIEWSYAYYKQDKKVDIINDEKK